MGKKRSDHMPATTITTIRQPSGPSADQRAFLANIMRWERESQKQAVVIRGRVRVRRVGKASHA